LIKHKYEECLINVTNLHTQIKIKNTKITNLTVELSNRDKDIIDLRSKITILELHLNNCKSENEKIINDLNITIRNLEINIKTCKSEKETLIIYKTKYEKCDSNCTVNITKLNQTINIMNMKITNLTEKLKKIRRKKIRRKKRKKMMMEVIAMLWKK
jgi:chromosome segregation ATPase